MRNEEVSLLPKMLMLTGSLVLYYGSLFSLGAYAKRKCGLSFRFYLTMAAVGACFVGVMLVFRSVMYANIAITVLFVFGVFAALRRMDRKAVSGEE